jgi:hypothetical protein
VVLDAFVLLQDNHEEEDEGRSTHKEDILQCLHAVKQDKFQGNFCENSSSMAAHPGVILASLSSWSLALVCVLRLAGLSEFLRVCQTRPLLPELP